MSLYMISNREVIKDANEKEHFSNDGSKVALNNFRIAECFASEDNKQLTYNILDDTSDPDYGNVEKVIDGTLEASQLGGTEKLFYDLYQSMKMTSNHHQMYYFSYTVIKLLMKKKNNTCFS